MNYWLSSNELGLTGDDAIRWEGYRHSLNKYGIKLHDREDQLKWDHSPDGSILAKVLYDFMVKEHLELYQELWHLFIWKWNLP